MQPGKPFASLWLSQGASNLSDGIFAVAAPLVVAAITRDPIAVATMTAVQFVPRLVFALPVGVLTDRADRRRVLIGGNALRAIALGLLATAVAAGHESLWILYVAVFITGTAEMAVDNAALTVPPRIVPRERLERANGRLLATQSVIDAFIGPPVGSALVMIAGSLAMYTSAGVFALAAVAAWFLPALLPQCSASVGPRAQPPSIAESTREGWIYFWSHRILRRVAFFSAAINLFGTATGAVLVLLVTGPLGMPPGAYGLFLAVPAAGAIAGSFFADRIIRCLGGGPVMCLAALVPAASYLLLGLIDNVVVMLVVMLVAAIATSCNQVVVSTLRQAVVPDRLLGRVTAAYRLIVLGAVPLGAVSGGIVAAQFGLRSSFVIAAAGLAVAACVLAPQITTSKLRAAEATRTAPDPT